MDLYQEVTLSFKEVGGPCTRVILTKKKYFHRLESDSARNSIHPNIKHKPEIANKNTRKITCQYGQPD